MNKIFKITFLIVIILFFILYFSRYTTNYYNNQNILTEEAMKRFEEDLKKGKKIIPSNYLVEEKDYNNNASNIGRKTSKFIENIFNKGLSFIIKGLEKMDNS